MRFGDRVRYLRRRKGLSLREVAAMVGVNFTYLSRVETHKLSVGDYPSEALIHRLAEALGGDEDELLILAKKIPKVLRRRFLERPEAFRKLAELDDRELDRVLEGIGTSSGRSLDSAGALRPGSATSGPRRQKKGM